MDQTCFEYAAAESLTACQYGNSISAVPQLQSLNEQLR